MAVGRAQQEGATGAPRGEAAGRTAANTRVLALLARHESSLMRVARQWSLCRDDALDAFQRGLEIYVRRLETVDPATEAAWLKVVIRHEAMAIRRARGDCMAPDVDLDNVVPAAERSVEEQVLSGDRVSRSAEALRALKPDEARALMLKAHGLSYDEIGRRCGWTYTKVNRAITEGRRRFMEVYASLEDGSECERFGPILHALAAGTASSAQIVEVRPHLRRCSACRATVRDLHLSGLRRIRLLAPLPAIVVPLRWLRERLGGHRGGGGHGGSADPSAISDPHLTPWHPPDVTPRIGDVVLPHAAGGAPERMAAVGRAKQHVASLLHRANSSDLAAGIHIATTTGGGRIAALGAMVGLCVSGAAAGTVCVVTGIVHMPLGLFDQHHGAVVRVHEPAPRAASGGSTPSGPTVSAVSLALRAAVTPTPTPTPTPRPRHRPRPRRADTHLRHVVRTSAPAVTPTPSAPPASADPAQGTAPTSQQHAPVSPAPAQPAAQEFSAAPASGSGTGAAPAAAPATGGEEFGP